MGMKFTQIPENTFKQLVLNAGIIVDTFDPSIAEIGNIVGATSGGWNFAVTPTFNDAGEDIDNAPRNTMELKQLDDVEVTASGTFVTVSEELAKRLMAMADITVTDGISKITPRRNLKTEDFEDLWLIADYSDENEGTSAGFIAIHMMNTLSTGGFSIQTQDRNKSQFAFTFMAHYSLEAQDVVPYEIYVKAGDENISPVVVLNRHVATIKVGDTLDLNAVTVPNDATVTWASSNTAKASVSDGTVTGAQAGNTIITASITVDGVPYTDTCTVIVESA